MAKRYSLPSNVLGGGTVAIRPIQRFKDWASRLGEVQIAERARESQKRQYPSAPANSPASVPQLAGTKAKGSLGGGTQNQASNTKAR